jgi:hypothetical protein
LATRATAGRGTSMLPFLTRGVPRLTGATTQRMVERGRPRNAIVTREGWGSQSGETLCMDRDGYTCQCEFIKSGLPGLKTALAILKFIENDFSSVTDRPSALPLERSSGAHAYTRWA